MSVPTFTLEGYARTGSRDPVAGQLISPLSTGGAGVIFEYHIGAIMLSRLLRGAHVPVGIQRPLARVGFQQGNSGFSFDDIVAHADVDSLGSPQCIQIQVKKRIQITGSDTTFVKVMAAALDACQGCSMEPAEGKIILGLAAVDQLAALGDLTRTARAHSDSETFASQFQTGVTNSHKRSLYGHVQAAVAAAAAIEDPHAIRHWAHLILARLHVWQVPEGPDSATWRAELDGLTEMSVAAGKSSADLLGHLYRLAEDFGPRGGLVDADHVRAQLLSQYGIRVPLTGATTLARQAPLFTITQSGDGTVFAAEQQVFNGLNIGIGRAAASGRGGDIS
jgi:hypothetical protein